MKLIKVEHYQYWRKARAFWWGNQTWRICCRRDEWRPRCCPRRWSRIRNTFGTDFSGHLLRGLYWLNTRLARLREWFLWTFSWFRCRRNHPCSGLWQCNPSGQGVRCHDHWHCHRTIGAKISRLLWYCPNHRLIGYVRWLRCVLRLKLYCDLIGPNFGHAHCPDWRVWWWSLRQVLSDNFGRRLQWKINFSFKLQISFLLM